MPDKLSEREKDKKAQEARSKRYHIAIKEGGHVTKPSDYKNLSDEQFADPVNYRYPIDKEHIHGAITYWAKPKNQEQYSSGEKKIISDRIEKAKKKFKIGEYKEAKDYFIGKSIELKGIPERIQITPLGILFHKVYGRFEVTREDVAQMVANFNLQENDTLIDYEHQTLLNVEAPAAGWIKKLVDEGGDGLWADPVEWLERAKGYIEKKEYKYLSPVITYNNKNPKTGENIGTVLHSCGLTNTPFITGIKPLVSKNILKEEVEMIEKIKELLGLSADASDEDVLSKIEALLGASKKVEEVAGKFTEILSKLGLKEDAKAEEITAKIDALKESKKEDDPRLKDITSELELKEDATTEEIKAKLVALKKSNVPDGFVAKEVLDGLKEKFDKKERNEIVNETIRAGKIGNKEHLEWAKEYALKDPDGFKKWADNAPIIADPKKFVLDEKGPEKFAMTEEDKKVANMLGVSEESFKKHNTP